jgi:hypothetical protein
MKKKSRECQSTCSKDLELNSDGVLFQVHNIYGTHAVGFPRAKSQQQPQDFKPQIGGMAWNS